MLNILMLAFLVNCTEPYQFSVENTTRILKILSADEMNGRHALSQDIKAAEDFISSEFAKAGLNTIPENNSYFQEFELHSVSMNEVNFRYNNKKVDPSAFFGFLRSASFSLNESSTKTVTIGSLDNFRSRFNSYRNSEENLLVLVSPSHQDDFSRYQSFFSRPTRSMELDKTGNVIFLLTNDTPKSFQADFENEVESFGLRNVTGMIEGRRKDEIVLFSAHHDHIGIRNAVETDSIANGANDNASGVSAVIELANYFASLGKPERTLMFVTFTAEEMGGYGSQYFSQQLDPDQITAMFNIEMIGKPAVEGPNSAWITGFDKSSFGELLQKSAEGSIYSFKPDPYPQQNLFYRSDNATLARLGVPAHTISTTPIDVDEDYHRVSDEFETLNIEHITNTIKAIAKAAKGIVSGKDTPTRVNPDNLN